MIPLLANEFEYLRPHDKRACKLLQRVKPVGIGIEYASVQSLLVPVTTVPSA